MTVDLTNAKRAEILTEALPYIRKYSGRIIVIKYGGNAMLEKAVEQGRGGDFAGAENTLKSAEADWDRHADFYGVVLSHAETDDILRAFSSLREYARLGDQDDFLSGCAELARTLEHLREMELPLAKNVL